MASTNPPPGAPQRARLTEQQEALQLALELSDDPVDPLSLAVAQPVGYGGPPRGGGQSGPLGCG